MISHSLFGCFRPVAGRSGAVPLVGVRSPGAFCPGLLGLALLALACTLGACASRSLDDMSPEIRRDAADQPEPAVVELRDLRSKSAAPIVFLLANKSGNQLVARMYGGRLPSMHKEISSDRMGQLVAYMRYQGFFDHARQVADSRAALPQAVRRTLTLWTGEREILQMLDVRGMADAGRRDEVVAVSEISKAIRHISNQTLSLKVDPTGRSAQDFYNQPGLQRDGRGKR